MEAGIVIPHISSTETKKFLSYLAKYIRIFNNTAIVAQDDCNVKHGGKQVVAGDTTIDLPFPNGKTVTPSRRFQSHKSRSDSSRR